MADTHLPTSNDLVTLVDSSETAEEKKQVNDADESEEEDTATDKDSDNAEFPTT